LPFAVTISRIFFTLKFLMRRTDSAKRRIPGDPDYRGTMPYKGIPAGRAAIVGEYTNTQIHPRTPQAQMADDHYTMSNIEARKRASLRVDSV
jgi:hypothetical protein